MMSVSDSDNLQTLLSNLNMDISTTYNNDKKVEKLVLQLGELSARYSDLASRYLKLVNSKINEPGKASQFEYSENASSVNNGIQKSLLDIISVLFANKAIYLFIFGRNFQPMFLTA